MESGQDPGEGSRHTVRGLPGFQQVRALWPAGGAPGAPRADTWPAGVLDPLVHRGGGGVDETGPRCGDGAGAEAATRAAHVSRAREGGRAVRRRAARGLLGLVVFGGSPSLALLGGRATGAPAASVAPF